MTSVQQSFDTGHMDMVHDAQFDYYGKRLATCSSDRVIRIFDVSNDQHALQAELHGHEGPVWQVTWAHPKFGAVLASCSFDHRVIVWKEAARGQWTQVYVSPPALFQGSVNSIAFAPYELGLVLACGSSDGSIALLTYDGTAGEWHPKKLANAHPLGCTAVSWAPAAPLGALVSGAAPSAPIRRLVSGGCDNTVKIWRGEGHAEWMEETVLREHGDWVRDVAWAPSLGLPSASIASCSQDGRVLVYSQDAASIVSNPSQWVTTEVCRKTGGVPVWRVSWSVTGNVLAVTDGNNEVTLWKESIDRLWQQVA